MVQKAQDQEHFERTLISIQGQLAGSLAAIESSYADSELNYGEIFVGDNVPVMNLFAGAGSLREREAISEGLSRSAEHERANPWGFSDKFRRRGRESGR